MELQFKKFGYELQNQSDNKMIKYIVYKNNKQIVKLECYQTNLFNEKIELKNLLEQIICKIKK
jgi:hypothetical protein